MKTVSLNYLFLDAMTDPTKFKSFKVKLKEGALPKIKLRRSATYTVQSVQKPSKVFKTYQLHIGRNWYNAEMFRLVTEQEETIDLSKYKAFPERYKVPYGVKIRSIKICKSGDVKIGAIGTIVGDGSTMPKFICDIDSDYLNGESDYVFEPIEFLAPLYRKDYPDYQPDHSVTDQFQPEPIHPDNATIETLIQYVSEHREAMTKESILHFANLIGLIKLGAL